MNTNTKSEAKAKTSLLKKVREHESYFATFARMAGYKSVDAVFSGIGEGLLKKGNIVINQEELFQRLTSKDISFFQRFMKNGLLKESIINDKINKLWEMELNSDVVNIMQENRFHIKNLGEVFTPPELLNETLDLFPSEIWSNPNLTWLDPTCGSGNFLVAIYERLMFGLEKTIPDADKRKKHILEKMIHGSELRTVNVLLSMARLDIDEEFNLNIKLMDFLEDNWNMKFDVVVGNPPYTKGVHLKFVDKAMAISNQYTVMIHPVNWILSKKRNKPFEKFNSKIGNKLEKVVLFNPNAYFSNVGIFAPCGITYLNSKKTQKEVLVINKFLGEEFIFSDKSEINHLHGSSFSSIQDKIMGHGKFIREHIRQGTGNYYVNIEKVIGNINKNNKQGSMHKDDFYRFFYDYNKFEITSEPKIIKQFIGFQTEREALNFNSYLHLKFSRFSLTGIKFHNHLAMGELDYVPWLDWNIKWTDEMLYKYFNLTDQEVQTIESIID